MICSGREGKRISGGLQRGDDLCPTLRTVCQVAGQYVRVRGEGKSEGREMPGRGRGIEREQRPGPAPGVPRWLGPRVRSGAGEVGRDQTSTGLVCSAVA